MTTILKLILLVAVLSGLAQSSFARQRAVRTPSPLSDRIGLSDGNYTDVPAEPGKWATLASKKIGWVRYWVRWDLVAPHKPRNDDDYNWAVTDHEVFAMVSAGLKVYLNFGAAPAWAIENKPRGVIYWPAYDGGDSCMTHSYPYVFVGTLPDGLKTHPWCGEYKPSIAEWTKFLRAAVKHFINAPFNITYFGMWNEPNYDIFWHYHDYSFANQTDEGWKKSPNLSIVKEILVPGYRAIKDADSRAIVVGPEIDGPLNLKWILLEEKKQGPIADIISIHAYGANLFQGAYDVHTIFDGEHLGPADQTQGYGKIIRDFGKGRAVWLTETWMGTTDTQLFWDEIKKRTWLDKVFIHGRMDWEPPN